MPESYSLSNNSKPVLALHNKLLKIFLESFKNLFRIFWKSFDNRQFSSTNEIHWDSMPWLDFYFKWVSAAKNSLLEESEWCFFTDLTFWNSSLHSDHIVQYFVHTTNHNSQKISFWNGIHAIPLQRILISSSFFLL